MSEIEGVKEWTTEAGWHVMRIHYTAHPVKRKKAWIENYRKKLR